METNTIPAGPVPHSVLQAIRPEQILKAYRGKHACMCGCKGRYFVRADKRAAADKERGYAYEDRDVSDVEVTKVLRELQASKGVEAQDGYIIFSSRKLCKQNLVVYLDV
jgi:hypothetical protein